MLKPAAKQPHLSSGSWALIAATGLVNIAMVLYHRVMSARLGADYGQLVALFAVINVLGNVTLGLNTALVKVFSADAELRGPGSVMGRMRSLLAPGLIALAAATVLLLLVAPLITQYLKLPSNGPVMLALLACVGGVVVLALRAALQGLHYFYWLGFSLVADSVLRLGWAYAPSANGVSWGLGALLVGQCAGAIVALGWIASAGKAAAPAGKASAGPRWRKALQEAGAHTLALTLFAMMGFLDVFVLKHHYDDSRASLYGRAALVAKSFLYLAGALNLVVLPAAARELAAKRDPRPLLKRFLGLALGLDIVGLVVVCAFTPLCLRILVGDDPAFLALVPLIRWFSLAVIPLALLQLCLAYLLAVRQRGVVPALAALTVLYAAGLQWCWPHEMAVVALLGGLSTLGLVVALVAALKQPPKALELDLVAGSVPV